MISRRVLACITPRCRTNRRSCGTPRAGQNLRQCIAHNSWHTKGLQRRASRAIIPGNEPGRAENRPLNSTCELHQRRARGCAPATCSMADGTSNRCALRCVCHGNSTQRKVTVAPCATDVGLRGTGMTDEEAQQRRCGGRRPQHGIAAYCTTTGFSCSARGIVLARILEIGTITESWGVRRPCEVDVPGERGESEQRMETNGGVFRRQVR